MENVCVICDKLFPAHGMKKTCSEECRKTYMKIYKSREEVKERKRESNDRHTEYMRIQANEKRARKAEKEIAKAARVAKKNGMSYGQAEAVKYMQISEDEKHRREILKKSIAESKKTAPKECRCVKCHKQIDIDSQFCKFCGGFQRRKE